MKPLQTILSTALYTSSFLGIQILLMDKWLWNAAPTHAYGLIIFVIIDCIILAALWKEQGLATIGAALVSIAQLVAMLSDIVIGQPAGVPANTFKNYLLADTAFVSLLSIQGVILVLAASLVIMPLAHRHGLALWQIRKQ